jgi:hypothetical protein
MKSEKDFRYPDYFQAAQKKPAEGSLQSVFSVSFFAGGTIIKEKHSNRKADAS